MYISELKKYSTLSLCRNVLKRSTWGTQAAKLLLPFFERQCRRVNNGNAYLSILYADNGKSCIHKNNLVVTCDLQIIVPVYNTEKYVEACINSILSQKTKYDYIVTVINDGSTDGSCQLLRKYERDSRIEIIDQENKGHGGARNTGLQVIRGGCDVR